MKFITYYINLLYIFIYKIYKITQTDVHLYKIVVYRIPFIYYLFLILPYFSLFVDVTQSSIEVNECSIERIELAIYRAITRDACRIYSEILNFCGKRSARRIDTISQHPSHAILQRAFCLWQPLVRNDKHNVHEMD